MTSLIIGASAGLGRELAECLAKAGHNLFLVASDVRDLDAVSRDLRLRYGVAVDYLAVDLVSPDAKKLRAQVLNVQDPITNLFYVAGVSIMDTGAIPEDTAKRLIAVNFDTAVILINAFLEDIRQTANSNIVAISSVAAARGRRVNSIYGAAKRGLEAYVESLRHLLAQSTTRVQCYRVGYMQTRMLFGQKLLFPAVAPAVAARVIVTNLGKDTGLVYLPSWWFLIITIIRLLPWPIFKKLNI